MFASRLLRRAAVVATLAISACAVPAPSASPAIGPLIWDVAGGRFVAESELASRLAAARFRLLGEVHDNPEHHLIRAGLVRRIVAAGVRPAIVFEQFDLDYDDALQRVQAPVEAGGAGAKIDADILATAGALDRAGWLWPLHRPLFEAALAAGLRVRAGNAPRRDLMRAARAPAGTVPDANWGARYAAARWTPAQDAALREDIVEAHCGKLPAQAVAPVARAQRMRDAAMAQALVDAANRDGAILIAGNGHVRRDMGVPAYVRTPGMPEADAALLSVGLLETEPADRAATDFPRAFLADKPGFDYIWFTAAALREDPCERMPGPGAAPAKAGP